MFPSGAEHQRLFLLVNLLHKEINPVSLTFFDDDGSVKIGLTIYFTLFNLTLNDLVIRCVNIIIQRGGDLLDLERGQEAIVNAFFEGIDINRFTEVAVGIGIVFS